MANSINRFEIVGNVGKNGGEFDAAKGNEGLGTFSLAYNHPTRRAEDGTYPQGKTSWFRIKAWGKLGEVVGRLKKGQRVRVTARLEQNVWKDKKGALHYDLDIIAENVQLISTIPASEQEIEAEVELDEDAPVEENLAEPHLEVVPKAAATPKPRTGIISKDGIPVQVKAAPTSKSKRKAA